MDPLKYLFEKPALSGRLSMLGSKTLGTNILELQFKLYLQTMIKK